MKRPWWCWPMRVVIEPWIWSGTALLTIGEALGDDYRKREIEEKRRTLSERNFDRWLLGMPLIDESSESTNSGGEG